MGEGVSSSIDSEAGIGKTILAKFICDEAATQGACVLVGR